MSARRILPCGITATGDGEIDQWGYNHAYGVNYLRYWPASNGFDWIVEVDGQTNINLMDDRMVETLEFLHQLELEGLVGVGVPIEKQVMFAPNFVHILQNEPARADYRHSMVPLPKGPSADDNIVVGGGAVWGASIPITAKHNPRDIIEVVHALMQSSIPYIEYMNVYADLEDWQNEYWREREMISPDRRTFETWQWMESNIVQPFEPPIFGVTSAEGERIWNTLYNDVIIGGGSPSAVLGELQPVAEDLFAPYQERLYGGQ